MVLFTECKKFWSNPCTCLDKPWVCPGVWGSQLPRHSAHEGGKFINPTNRHTLPSGNILRTNFR